MHLCNTWHDALYMGRDQKMLFDLMIMLNIYILLFLKVCGSILGLFWLILAVGEKLAMS